MLPRTGDRDDGENDNVRPLPEGWPEEGLTLVVAPRKHAPGLNSLLRWAFEQADATVPPTPIWLESQPSSMAMYEHVGFQWIGENRFLRRGPGGAKAE